MKVHVVPRPGLGPAGQATMPPIQAIDLTPSPEHRPLWRSPTPQAVPPVGLPVGGSASPMGYWLSAADSGPAPPGGLRITFQSPGDMTASPSPAPEPAPTGRRGRPTQTVRLKSPNAGEGELVLTIGATTAHVFGGEAAWITLAEPALLAICQCWRFRAIDAEIDRLTELAQGDLDHATMPGFASLRNGRRLAESARAVRVLMLDLPHFEGPLTDAARYCSTDRATQHYETLAEKLDLEEWCELIDERAEAIEDAYEAVTEKLFEYRNFAWEAILEVLIIVILLAELAVQVYGAFYPD